MAAVAAELRSPILPFTALPLTRRTLPIIRLLFSIRTKSGPGVSVTERYVGELPVRALPSPHLSNVKRLDRRCCGFTAAG
jgi:hypothetical protein